MCHKHKMPVRRFLSKYGNKCLDFDKTPLPRGAIPLFGVEAGFGLIRHAPELYRKLALFGPEMEEIVIQLVEEAVRYDVSLPQDLITLASGRAGTPRS